MQKKWLRVCWCAALLFLLATFVHWFVHGGSALNGKVENGRYYVATRGRMTEVSKEQYAINYAVTIGFFITFSITIVGSIATRKRSSGIASAGYPDNETREPMNLICPHCQRMVTIGERGGETTTCPLCNRQFMVPRL
jgi:hypothetical protein